MTTINAIGGNVVVNGQNNVQTLHISGKDDIPIDWEGLSALLNIQLSKIPNGSNEKNLLTTVLRYCETKNREGLLRFLNEHKNQFVSGTLQSAMGGLLSSAILMLLNLK